MAWASCPCSTGWKPVPLPLSEEQSAEAGYQKPSTPPSASTIMAELKYQRDSTSLNQAEVFVGPLKEDEPWSVMEIDHEHTLQIIPVFFGETRSKGI